MGSPTKIAIDPESRLILRAATAEQERAPLFRLPLHLDLTAALAIVGNLQLAMRHPGNDGPSREVARTLIDGIIERMETSGFPASAALARMGDDPRRDV